MFKFTKSEGLRPEAIVLNLLQPLLAFVVLCPLWSGNHLVGQEAKSTEPESEEVFTEVEPGVRLLGKPSRSAVLGHVLEFVEVSPNRFLVVGSDNIRLWNDSAKKVEKTYPFESPISDCRALAVSNDKRRVAISTWSYVDPDPAQAGQVLVFDAKLELLNEIVIDDRPEVPNSQGWNLVSAIAFSPDDQKIAVGTLGAILFFDLESSEVLQEFKLKEENSTVSKILVEDDQVVALGVNQELFELETGKVLKPTDGLKAIPKHFFSAYDKPTNRLFFSTFKDVKAVDLATGKVKPIKAFEDAGNCYELYLSQDGGLLGVVHIEAPNPKKPSQSGLSISIIDTKDLALKYRFSNVPGRPTQIHFDDKNESIQFALNYSVGTQRLVFDKTKVEQTPSYKISVPVNSVLLSPNGSRVATQTSSGKVFSYDWTSGESMQLKPANYFFPTASDGFFALTQKGTNFWIEKRNFANSKSKKVRSYALRKEVAGSMTGFLFGMSKNPVGNAYYVVPSSLAINDTKSELHAVVWDGLSGIRVQTFKLPGYKKAEEKLFKRSPTVLFEGVSAISANGKRLAVYEPRESKKLQVFDVETEDLLFESKAANVSGLLFSTAGDWLAVASKNDVTIYEAETGKPLKKIEVENALVALAYSSSALLVAPRKKDQPVRVFNTQNWELKLSHKTNTADRISAAISHDGQRVVFGLNSCCVELWDLGELQD